MGRNGWRKGKEFLGLHPLGRDDGRKGREFDQWAATPSYLHPLAEEGFDWPAGFPGLLFLGRNSAKKKKDLIGQPDF